MRLVATTKITPGRRYDHDRCIHRQTLSVRDRLHQDCADIHRRCSNGFPVAPLLWVLNGRAPGEARLLAAVKAHWPD